MRDIREEGKGGRSSGRNRWREREERGRKLPSPTHSLTHELRASFAPSLLPVCACYSAATADLVSSVALFSHGNSCRPDAPERRFLVSGGKQGKREREREQRDNNKRHQKEEDEGTKEEDSWKRVHV